MSEAKLISPMLDNFLMGEPISDHNGVRCYPAIKEDTDERYIVKIISSPASESQLEALLLSGAYAEKDDALSYFKGLSEDILAEVSILDELSKLEGFISFVDRQLVTKEDESGFDVYLLSQYHYALQKRMRQNSMTHLEAVNLGLDMCAALAACRRSGYLYVDLKPSNIYITEDNSFRIGDLGLMKLDTLKYASLPERCRSQYTAPEIADAYATLNDTIDVYAAGLILYQVYNNGVLPVIDPENPQPLSAPAFADYEMAEIILKACALSPEDRWKDPVEFGQAIVDYIQRNGVDDVPITPVLEDAVIADPEDEHGAYETEENAEATDAQMQEDAVDEDDTSVTPEDHTESEATEVAEDTPAEETTTEDIYTVDEEGNLTMLSFTDEDEAIAEEAEAIDYAVVTDEVSDMMQQADELIAHETPEPVVQPEPIDVPIPPPIVLEDDENDQSDKTLDASSDEEEKTEVEEDTETECEENTANSNEDTESAKEDEQPKKKGASAKKWIRNILLLLLAAAIVAGGIFFYKNYYLQPIESIVLEEGENGKLIVYVTSQIDESKLRVICSDIYGNQLYASVANGKAEFDALAPNSAYTVRVDMKGFHKLIGDVSAAYTTPLLTNIVSFSAVTGSEETSIILNFTIDGPDSEQWKVTYTGDNGEVLESIFAGHTITLNGFTVGNAYTFTLAPVSDIQVTGNTEVTYTASQVVKAKNLMISSCSADGLAAAWTAPKGATVDSWTVRCYNEADYDETTVTSDTTATFKIPDPSVAYTVEVTASGMSVNERVFASKDSITVSDFTAELADQNNLAISWTSDRTPNGGWTVSYSIDDSAQQEISCDGTATQISPVIPGTTYAITLTAADGSGVFGNILVHNVPEANKFEGYAVNADLMEVFMCRTPSYSGWNRYDLSDSDYTTQFKADEKASLLIHLRSTYDRSHDEITTLYVIRDENGAVVGATTTSATWQQMWYRNYCELDIPQIPQTAGNYTLSLFFNCGFVTDIPFEITN